MKHITISIANNPIVTPSPDASSVSFLSYSMSEYSSGRQAITFSSLDIKTVTVRTKWEIRLRNLVGTSPLACNILRIWNIYHTITISRMSSNSVCLYVFIYLWKAPSLLGSGLLWSEDLIQNYAGGMCLTETEVGWFSNTGKQVLLQCVDSRLC